MQKFSFSGLGFTVSDENKITLDSFHSFNASPSPLCEFDLVGGASGATNFLRGSEYTPALCYVSHNIDGDILTVTERSDIVEITSTYEKFDSRARTNAVRVSHSIKNISASPITLELANTVSLKFSKKAVSEANDWFLHRFRNLRYTESLPEVTSLSDCGLQWKNGSVHIENVGNYSSMEHIPEAIIEHRPTGDMLFFQIESYHGWSYEIGYSRGSFALEIGGPTALRHAWNKVLAEGEKYLTVPVTLTYAVGLGGAIADMTEYRRVIKGTSKADESLPTIYNEYMHYSWDDPIASRVYETAPAVAEVGCEYYVIDCGWHNGRKFDDMLGMYKQFGTWFEDRERFPDGLKAMSDYIHSLGMKFGLWLAPEVVGRNNKKMLEYYDDSCFFMRGGKKLSNNTGYILDFRAQKVRDYMTETIRRMVEDYGCDYIKFDGCPNSGFGTEISSTSLGDGLERAMDAFIGWAEEMIKKYPNVIFEDCAAGGQRLDYKALSVFSLASTSDQTAYNKYPYISSNILASVLPEQAAVWSYPVDSKLFDAEHPDETDSKVTKERVVINMVNAMLGRIHLASRIQLLSPEKRALIKEGIEVYREIGKIKQSASPVFPSGYAKYGDKFVSCGLKKDDKAYIVVWNLGGEKKVTLPLSFSDYTTVKEVKVKYPTALETKFGFCGSSLTVEFTEDEQARLFEITLTSGK